MRFDKTNYLKEMSWKRFVERKQSTNLAIIPSGACEVYGPHLPLGTDTLVAQKMSELVSERVNSIIGPTLEVGDSSSLDVFPGTITIRPENFKQYLYDSVMSLKKWGFKDFLFLNTHLGNVPIINQLALELQRDEEIRCMQTDYWRLLKTLDKGVIESGDLAHAHASEAGTSVILYLYPELCDVENWINEPPKLKDKFPDLIKYYKFSQKTTSGTIGDATLGTKEKGKELVKRSLDRIIQFLVEEWHYTEK
jgi:Uncharacterized protein, putative amidase